MPDPRQLAYLIRLMDDNSQEVRETVLRELCAFGTRLQDELQRQNIPLTPEQLSVIQNLSNDCHRTWLKSNWPSWFDIADEKEKLERALILLAGFQLGPDHPVKLDTQLDAFAAEYLLVHEKPYFHTLADFLFREMELKGVEEDYYNPVNSNLIQVIERKQGIPISLVTIYMLVGWRLGLKIEGCNFPGHFLACAYDGPDRFLVDCYNGGRVITQKDLSHINPATALTIEEILDLECDAVTIVGRVLRNLINAYQVAKQQIDVRLMADLLDMLDIYGRR